MSVKIYIVKYAATRGIIVRDDAVATDDPYIVVIEDIGIASIYYQKGEWTKNPDEARTMAIASIEKKRTSLRTQFTKLDALQRKIDQEYGYPARQMDLVYPD